MSDLMRSTPDGIMAQPPADKPAPARPVPRELTPQMLRAGRMAVLVARLPNETPDQWMARFWRVMWDAAPPARAMSDAEVDAAIREIFAADQDYGGVYSVMPIERAIYRAGRRSRDD